MQYYDEGDASESEDKGVSWIPDANVFADINHSSQNGSSDFPEEVMGISLVPCFINHILNRFLCQN